MAKSKEVKNDSTGNIIKTIYNSQQIRNKIIKSSLNDWFNVFFDSNSHLPTIH
jgi:hypothetical protein